MSAANTHCRALHVLFEQQPCWMIDPLARELRYSVPSVRRMLGGVGYFSSFTHNGRWYTLKSIPAFDRDGLWFSDDIGFSGEGSLTDTLTRLASRSPAGMTADQLGLKLHCRCHAVLVRLHRCGRLQRQKEGRSYVYLAADAEVASRQRRALAESNVKQGPLPAEIAVLVFAEFIRHPDASFEELCGALARGSRVQILPTQINRLFEQHGVKKTTATPLRVRCAP